MTQYKTCTKCGQLKTLDAFARDKYKKSGVTSSCLECRNSYQKQKRKSDPEYRAARNQSSKDYYYANREDCAKKNKRWARENPDKRRKIDARFRANHREQEQQRAIAYRKRNPSKRLEWARSNPEKQAAIYAKRSFARRGGDRFSISLAEIRKMYASPCAYCGAPSEHIDHIMPLARGGRHSIGNLTGACKNCNLSKGSKFITEWRKGKNEAR